MTRVDPRIHRLRDEMERELTGGILPYWARHAVDREQGGFAGLITGDGALVPGAPKGAVLNARILWTFSAAHRVLGLDDWRVLADRAAVYFAAHFLDPTDGGAFWMLDAEGRPLDHRKHTYAQAFAIYGLAEHYRATGDDASLHDAIGLFRLVEAHAREPRAGGYVEAMSRDWVALADGRLSDEDMHASRTMNTHLHLLEAYANLFRVWPDRVVRDRLADLTTLFLDRIAACDGGHVHAFFDEDWHPISRTVSYGHDIETSWLLVEAAGLLKDAALHARACDLSLRLATAVRERGFDVAYGGVFTEGEWDEATVTDKEWWPQAEAIVGFLNAYERSGRTTFLEAALDTWSFTRRHVIDAEQGEWRRRVARDGTPRERHEKVGPWKCPYHNARACLEIMRRVPALVVANGGGGRP